MEFIVNLLVSAMWAGCLGFLITKIDANYRLWMKSQEPLADRQFKELKSEIDKLKQQVTRLNLSRGFDENA